MLEVIQNIIGWSNIVDTGVDAIVYFTIGAISTCLLMLRLALMLFGIDGDDADIVSGEMFDAADTDHMGSGAAFNLFSLLSIMAFFMGLGWMGLTCRVTWELGSTMSVAISVGSGVGMMLLASCLLWYVKKLEHVVEYDAKTCIGKTGRAYLTIPGDGKAGGQVEVNISGRRKIMNAKTRGGEIPAFTSIKVVEVGDDETLVVEPA
jgi:hypothetical protein